MTPLQVYQEYCRDKIRSFLVKNLDHHVLVPSSLKMKSKTCLLDEPCSMLILLQNPVSYIQNLLIMKETMLLLLEINIKVDEKLFNPVFVIVGDDDNSDVLKCFGSNKFCVFKSFFDLFV